MPVRFRSVLSSIVPGHGKSGSSSPPENDNQDRPLPAPAAG
ncbi:hypothetical protein DR88_5186 [Klebsiella pneumoniae]|nr:hypothetical protein DR88_5186 [Klebsiella pneumoniae]